MNNLTLYGRLGKAVAIQVALTLALILGVAAAVWGNLLVNPDAESGNTQGWTDPDDAWAADAEFPPHGGAYMFWPARTAIPQPTMYQDVDVSASSDIVDSGEGYLHLSGWLANWDQYPHDQSTLAIQATDGDGQQLLYLYRSHRSPVWTRYVIESRIPAGTRTFL